MRGVLVALGVGVMLFLLALGVFDVTQAKLIGVVAFLVTLWTNEALPLGVVSLMPLVLFPLLGIVELNMAAPNYAKSIIFLFLGGFLLAIAMQKLKLTEVIAAHLMRLFPKSATGVIYAVAITAALLSAFLSNTTVTIMLLPIALCLSKKKRLQSRYLLALAYGASIGGIFTPIGTPPNLILLGFLEEIGIEAPSFIAWMGLTLPVVGAMLLAVPWILARGVQDEPILCEIGSTGLDREQKRLAIILMLLVGLLIVNPLLKQFGYGLNEKMLLLGFGLLLFMPGIEILRWEDTKAIPYEIIFLFGAGFTIATAFIKTGLASAIADSMGVLGGLSPFVLLFLLAFFVSFSTEITSNTALTSIILPIVYEFAKNSALDPQILLFTATIAASYAFMLPIATPPNAIVMSSRAIQISQMARVGFVINMLGVVIVSVVAMTLWRLYFG